MQQIEALERLTSKLPPLVYEIGLNDACNVAINALNAAELEIYEYLIRYQDDRPRHGGVRADGFPGAPTDPLATREGFFPHDENLRRVAGRDVLLPPEGRLVSSCPETP